MKLINVCYPFEVDREQGTNDRLYSTLRSALKDAQSMYTSQAGEDEEVDNKPLAILPAVVTVSTVRRLTVGAVCEILNSGGHYWQLDEVNLGEIVWNGKKVKYIKGER